VNEVKKDGRSGCHHGLQKYPYLQRRPEWIKRGYPADILSVYPKPVITVLSGAVLRGMIDRKDDFLLVDLRDEEDRQAGWIKSSVHIEMEVLADRYQEIPKDKKIVLQDLFGKQGYMAARFLVSKGYKPENLVKLDGGFVDGWLKAGYPVEK
jgi:rhodanese-related sulfurtransferase